MDEIQIFYDPNHDLLIVIFQNAVLIGYRVVVAHYYMFKCRVGEFLL